jgi:hypothetical protein
VILALIACVLQLHEGGVELLSHDEQHVRVVKVRQGEARYSKSTTGSS